MLDKLEALVFGFEEFEKAKIDERFNQIPLILNKLNIREIRDFEILESVIFKIKELLRVKSSNLNSIIRNPKKKLNKKQVLAIVEALDKLKYDFLKRAFTAIKKEELSVEPIKEEIKIESRDNLVNEISNSYEILSNENVKVTIENGKIPYILLNFKSELDFVLIKNLSILLFDTFNCHGTNILTEKTHVLIIPRFENDNLFNLPQVQIDIDEVYSLLNCKESKVKDVEYKEVDDNQIKRPQTKEKQDDSLDALLNDMGDKNFKPKPNPKKDESKIEVEKGEPVEVTVDKTKEIEIIEEKKPKKESKPVEEKKESPLESKNFEIFRDDKIVIYLKEDSKVSGELIIENIFGKKLSEIEEPILTYMLMFSKAFGGILFETKEAHGTNIIYDFNDSKIRVVPRYQNDEISLNWNLTQATEDELEDVKDKLLKAMSSAMNSEKEEVKKESKEITEDKSNLKKRAEHILQSLQRIP